MVLHITHRRRRRKPHRRRRIVQIPPHLLTHPQPIHQRQRLQSMTTPRPIITLQSRQQNLHHPPVQPPSRYLTPLARDRQRLILLLTPPEPTLRFLLRHRRRYLRFLHRRRLNTFILLRRHLLRCLLCLSFPPSLAKPRFLHRPTGAADQNHPTQYQPNHHCFASAHHHVTNALLIHVRRITSSPPHPPPAKLPPKSPPCQLPRRSRAKFSLVSAYFYIPRNQRDCPAATPPASASIRTHPCTAPPPGPMRTCAPQNCRAPAA